jgi:hypothetical protein
VEQLGQFVSRERAPKRSKSLNKRKWIGRDWYGQSTCLPDLAETLGILCLPLLSVTTQVCIVGFPAFHTALLNKWGTSRVEYSDELRNFHEQE